MSKHIEDMPTSISEILRDIALEEECEELAQIADYIDDLEDRLHYYRESGGLALEYARKYARLMAGMQILAGHKATSKKLRTMHDVNWFADQVIKVAHER